MRRGTANEREQGESCEAAKPCGESSMRHGKSLRRDVPCTGAERGLYDTPFHEQEAVLCAAELRMKGSRAKAAKQRSHAGNHRCGTESPSAATCFAQERREDFMKKARVPPILRTVRSNTGRSRSVCRGQRRMSVEVCHQADSECS